MNLQVTLGSRQPERLAWTLERLLPSLSSYGLGKSAQNSKNFTKTAKTSEKTPERALLQGP